MRKLIALGAGALATAGAAVGMLGSGVAAADDLVGKTYAEASKALSAEGKTAKVMTTLGDQQDRASCVVTSATDAPFVRGMNATHDSNTVVLNLNCYASPASTGPGYSAGDQAPDAKAVRDAAAQ